MKNLRADEIIAILEAPLDLSWRRKRPVDWDNAIFADPAKHFYPRKVRLEREASVKELLFALRIAPTPRSRFVIIEILGRRKAKSAIPALIMHLSDRSPRVRNEAADAFVHIGELRDPRVGRALLQRFDGKEREIGIHSILALALSVQQYRPAIPSLIRALASEDEPTRRCAAFALRHMEAVVAIDTLQKAIDREEYPQTKMELHDDLDHLVSIAHNRDARMTGACGRETIDG